jgi:poly(glycerol-phosphate) alpha-glucosyltransferase
MNIAHLSASISRNAGGLLYSVSSLAKSVHNLGNDVQAMGLSDEYTEEDNHIWGDIATQTFPVLPPKQLGYSPSLKKHLLESDIDILHNNGLWMYPSYATYSWSKYTKKPYVISPRGMLDSWALNNSNLKKKLAKYLFEDKHLRNASCIHALNESEAQSIRDYGLNNPVCVIPNGVNITETDVQIAAPWSDRFLGESKILLYLGRLHPKKGLPKLLKAWPANSESGWKLVVAGWEENNHLSELKRIVSDRDLEEDVYFSGPLYGDLKKAALQNAGAFILPSHSEGMPMAILEAWSYKLPVLMTPECNIPEGFKKDAALRIEPKGESIASGLKTIFEMNGSKRQKIGENGYNLVKEQFTWDKIAEDMLSVYKWVLGNSNKPPCIFS